MSYGLERGRYLILATITEVYQHVDTTQHQVKCVLYLFRTRYTASSETIFATVYVYRNLIFLPALPRSALMVTFSGPIIWTLL